MAYTFDDRKLVSSLTEALQKQGNEVIDPFNLEVCRDISTEISTLMCSADIVIALIAVRSANIYLEVGFALGAGTPVIVAVRPGLQLPVDLAAIPFIELTGDITRDTHTIVRRLYDLKITKREIKQDFKSAEDALQAAVRDPEYLASMNPRDFESLIAKLLEDKGYKVNATEEEPDKGFDFVIESPKQKGLIMVEAKKMNKQSKISVESVRRLMSAIQLIAGATAGLLISTSGFTSAALALGAASSITMKTLEDILRAKSEKDIIATKETPDNLMDGKTK